MKDAAWVFLGAGLGGLLRWGAVLLAQRVAGAAFPWGTLAVNVVGCGAMGAVMALAEQRGWLSPSARLFLATGVLGGFTTFSSFGHEVDALVRRGSGSAALAYVAASVLAGLTAVVAGRKLVS
jgi:CrcB protein